MKYIIYLSSFIALLISAMGFFPSFSKFIFAGGSDSLMNIITSSILIRVFLAFILFIYIILYAQTLKKTIIPIIILTFTIWLFSGRMIAIFPYGRMSSGWFYMETNRINICNDNEDCEKVYYYETKVYKLNLWRIRLKNKNIDKIIFVGPFIWYKTLHLFSNTFKNPQNKKNLL